MDSVKKLLQDIVGLEGYEQLHKAVSKYKYPEACMSIIVSPRAIMSWASQCGNSLTKGESAQVNLPGNDILKVRFTRHDDRLCNIDIVGPDEKIVYQFKEEPIIDIKTGKNSIDSAPPKLTSGLFALSNIAADVDREQIAEMRKSADFKSITKVVGPLIDALISKKLTYSNVAASIDSLDKGLKPEEIAGIRNRKEGRNIDAAIARQQAIIGRIPAQPKPAAKPAPAPAKKPMIKDEKATVNKVKENKLIKPLQEKQYEDAAKQRTLKPANAGDAKKDGEVPEIKSKKVSAGKESQFADPKKETPSASATSDHDNPSNMNKEELGKAFDKEGQQRGVGVSNWSPAPTNPKTFSPKETKGLLGTSPAGEHVRYNEHAGARKEASRTLNEIRRQPKPNLPKSEIGKAEPLIKPKRGLRSLLAKPAKAIAQGFAAHGAATAGHDPVQHAYKLHPAEMKQIQDKKANPLPQPKPILQTVQVAAPAPQVKKTDLMTASEPKEKLSKPYVSEAQRGFFHTDTARRAGISAADTKHWDEASRGQHNLPEHKAKKAEHQPNPGWSSPHPSAQSYNAAKQAEQEKKLREKQEAERNKPAAKIKKDASTTWAQGDHLQPAKKQEGFHLKEKPVAKDGSGIVPMGWAQSEKDMSKGMDQPQVVATGGGFNASEKDMKKQSGVMGMSEEKCAKCSGHGKMFKHDDPKTEQWTVCHNCRGQGKIKKDAFGPTTQAALNNIGSAFGGGQPPPPPPPPPPDQQMAQKMDKVDSSPGVLPSLTISAAEQKPYDARVPHGNDKEHYHRSRMQYHAQHADNKDQAMAKSHADMADWHKNELEKAIRGPSLPGGAGAPKMNAQPTMPKPAVMPSNSPMGAAAKQSQASAKGKMSIPKVPGAASIKSPAAAKPPGMGMGKDEKNPDMRADAKLGENVEGLVERHFNDNKTAEAKEGHSLTTKSDYFHGKLAQARKAEGVPSIRNDGVSSVRNPGVSSIRNPGVSSIRNEGVSSIRNEGVKPVSKPAPKPAPTIKADYPADGTEKSERFYNVSASEIYANCEQCGRPEFTTGVNGAPVFNPCACFRVMVKDENDKPYKFVILAKKEDGSFSLKFNPTADKDAIKAFLLTLKSKLLERKNHCA